MAEDRQFKYWALDAAGKRVVGSLPGADEASVFERLRRRNLSPLKIVALRGRAGRKPSGAGEAETAELLGNLAELLKAGADMRTALSIIGARGGGKLGSVCQSVADEVGRGEALDRAFGKPFGASGAFVSAMVAAGEASGDLPGCLARAAEMMTAHRKLREKLISTLSYPAFVLASTVAAILALMWFVVPALAPLTQDMGSRPPASLAVMIAASDLLRANEGPLGIAAFAAVIALLLFWRTAAFRATVDRLIHDGPVATTARSVTFGAFSVALGGMLTAGAPMTEALRLSVRAVGSPLVRARLDPVQASVRQGQTLSAALAAVDGFPAAISRLASVGEATGSLGPMLTRGGRLEEEAAIKRIEVLGAVLGPATIVVLGGLVGVIMAGLLSGVSQLGQSALQ